MNEQMADFKLKQLSSFHEKYESFLNFVLLEGEFLLLKLQIVV